MKRVSCVSPVSSKGVKFDPVTRLFEQYNDENRLRLLAYQANLVSREETNLVDQTWARVKTRIDSPLDKWIK